MIPYLPIITALVSAIVVVSGWVYQRFRDREFEITKKRQEIYTKVIENLARKVLLFDKIKDDPIWPARITVENVDEAYAIVAAKYPELDECFNEARGIMSLLALYGSDEAIAACAEFYQQSLMSMEPGSRVIPDKNEWIRKLRKSLFPKTAVTAQQIGIITSR